MLSMVLALLLTASLSLAVFAAEPAKITVEKQTEAVNAGKEVTLAVTISDNPGFMSGVWKIEYDSSKLELKSINTKLDGRPYMDGSYTPNVARDTITYANAEAVVGDGTLFTLTFFVKENATSGETVVSVKTEQLFTKGPSGKVGIDNVSVAGGVTVVGSSTGGSSTGGSSTGGSSTGGSSTGGSSTGGSSTGGSSTGGSSTGGSSTGGSSTGGGSTGGSSTGGSSTSGSSTGGSSTGGSSTGSGSTGGTGSERKVELVGKSNNAEYKVTGNTLNVKNDAACVVLWTADNGKTYTKLAATKNEAGGYDFDLTSVPAKAVIKIAIKGDANGDGELDAADAAMIRAAEVGLGAGLTKLQEYIADINGDGDVDSADAALARSVEVGNMTLSW